MPEDGEVYRPPEVDIGQSSTKASQDWLARNKDRVEMIGLRIGSTALAAVGTFFATPVADHLLHSPDGMRGAGVAAATFLAWKGSGLIQEHVGR